MAGGTDALLRASTPPTDHSRHLSHIASPRSVLTPATGASLGPKVPNLRPNERGAIGAVGVTLNAGTVGRLAALRGHHNPPRRPDWYPAVAELELLLFGSKFSRALWVGLRQSALDAVGVQVGAVNGSAWLLAPGIL